MYIVEQVRVQLPKDAHVVVPVKLDQHDTRDWCMQYVSRGHGRGHVHDHEHGRQAVRDEEGVHARHVNRDHTQILKCTWKPIITAKLSSAQGTGQHQGLDHVRLLEGATAHERKCGRLHDPDVETWRFWYNVVDAEADENIGRRKVLNLEYIYMCRVVTRTEEQYQYERLWA